MGTFAQFAFGRMTRLLLLIADPSDLNHGITLNEAKNNYLEFGACERKMLRYVRPPESDEK